MNGAYWLSKQEWLLSKCSKETVWNNMKNQQRFFHNQQWCQCQLATRPYSCFSYDSIACFTLYDFRDSKKLILDIGLHEKWCAIWEARVHCHLTRKSPRPKTSQQWRLSKAWSHRPWSLCTTKQFNRWEFHHQLPPLFIPSLPPSLPPSPPSGSTTHPPLLFFFSTVKIEQESKLPYQLRRPPAADGHSTSLHHLSSLHLPLPITIGLLASEPSSICLALKAAWANFGNCAASCSR